MGIASVKQSVFSYSLGGFSLRSSLELPELGCNGVAQPEIILEALDVLTEGEIPITWFHGWTLPNGQRWLRLGRTANGYELDFIGLARFRISHDRKRVAFAPHATTREDTLRQLFLDQVFPLVVGTGARLAFHASAVAGPEGVIGFLGQTGWGKSTLGAGMAIHTSAKIVTDDCLLLEVQEDSIVAVPTYTGVRLWPSSCSHLFPGNPEIHEALTKCRVRWESWPSPVATKRERLARLYLLGSPDEPGIQDLLKVPVRGRSALIELFRHAYLLDPYDRADLGPKFNLIAEITTRIPIARLSYPREFLHLPQACRNILS